MPILMLIALLSLVLCGMALAQQPDRTTIYVSPDGDDGNPGTEQQPLATPHAARDMIRRLKAAALEAPVDVMLLGGTYYLDEPLVLGPDDSGTESCPITYKAADGAEVIVSGGLPVVGWSKQDDGMWSAPCPDWGDAPAPQTLRVGDEWAVRARHPNQDADNPYTGGWLFADYGGEPWERGALNQSVSNTHNVGDKLTWRVSVPADATYRIWLRYGHKMTTYGIEDMGGHTAIKADDGEWVPLMNLPDTGDWRTFKWAHVCDLELAAGEHVLTWTNQKGGGMELDALALCDDGAWDPNEAVGQPTWWGAFSVAPPAEGKHVVMIQCEACETAEGPEIRVPQPEPPGTIEHLAYKAGDIPDWQDTEGAEVHIFIAWGWVNAIVPVERIEPEQRRIVFTEGGAAQDVRLGNRYFIENVREALDAPGEWFFDTESNRILHIPASERFTGDDVVASRLDRLIVLQGDPETDSFVENVSFVGLKFMDAGYNLTRDYYTPEDAAIYLSAARNCAVRDCEFTRLGGYGIKLGERSEKCTVARNSIHHMGQGGVMFRGGTPVQPHHCEVLGNTMEHLGLIYKHIAGVYSVHGSDNRIAHNRITDVPRYAISLKSQGEDRLSHRNVVEYNEMIRTNLETNDTGAFESLGYEHRDSNNVVRYNLILDSVGLKTMSDGTIETPYFTWGVYLDDYSSGTLIYGNIVARTVVGGVCVHGGQNNRIENNIFVDGRDQEIRLQPRDDFMRGNTFINNIVVYDNADAELVASWNASKELFREWDRNLYWLRGADLAAIERKITPQGNWKQWLEAGFDAGSAIADPLFVDPENDDYSLQPQSPAFGLGFTRIPVEKIGPAGMTE